MNVDQTLLSLLAKSTDNVAYAGDSLRAGIRELLTTGHFSDFKIFSELDDAEFKVHRVVLYAQSKFFKKLLTGGFREAKKQEDSVTLSEGSSILQAVVTWMYAGSWDESARGDLSSTVFAVLVYQAADKYEIPALTTLAASRFKTACDPINNVPAFVEGIRHVDSCCNPKDRTLWNIVMPLIKKNMTHLLKFDEFKALIKENDELNFELLGQIYADEKGIEDEDEVDGSGGRRLGRLPGRPRGCATGFSTAPDADGW